MPAPLRIHSTPRGNGLPSACSQVGRFMSETDTVLAASAGPSMLASTSTLALFTVPLFHPLQPLPSLSTRQHYNSDKVRQRNEQFARAVPQDLHSDAHLQERGEL